MLPVEHVLALSAALFAIGAGGAIARRNLIVVLMSLQLMLAASMLALVAFNRALASEAEAALAVDGQVFAFLVLAVAAGELAIGLGIVVAMVRNRDSVNPDEASVMRW